MIKYLHEELLHNLDSPNEIVPEIIKIIDPKSVVDVGCGTATFLNCFKKQGVIKILGLDGKWANKDLLFKNILPSEFIEVNLEGSITLEEKFDLVVSLEVAEHISEKSADIFVENLVNLGGVILFSAAVPGQGGQNHINEKWLTYWEEKFSKHNYELKDVLRPIFWNNKKVFWWYKQNMVLFIPNGYQLKKDLNEIPKEVRNLIHYECFQEKTAQNFYKNLYSWVKQFIKNILILSMGQKTFFRLKNSKK
jgi:SAM-dependent methyltransferase